MPIPLNFSLLHVSNCFVLGLNPGANIQFLNTGESEFVSVLLDGNRTVYPLVKDSTPTSESLKDPHWLDLPPMAALGLGTHALPHVGSGKKNEVAVIVFSFVPQTLMPKILQCDIDGKAGERLFGGKSLGFYLDFVVFWLLF